jgi:hypothetical protein
MQGGFYFNAPRLPGTPATKVLDDDIDALNHDAILLIDHLADFASLTAVASTYDDYFVACSDLAHLVVPFALKHFWRKRDDPHELPLTKLAPDGTKYAGPARIALQIDQHGSIVIKLDMASIRSAIFLRCPNDYRPNHVAFFDAGIGLRRFHGSDDDIADAAPSSGRPAQYANAHDFTCTAVVCDAQSRLWLNHGVTSPINCKRLLEICSTLNNLTDNPPLIFGERSGLLNPHKIAFVTRVAVVVRKERAGSGDSLVIQAVSTDVIHRDHDGFIHLVAFDATDFLSPGTLFAYVRSCCCFRHDNPSCLCLGRLGLTDRIVHHPLGSNRVNSGDVLANLTDA